MKIRPVAADFYHVDEQDGQTSRS